MADTGDLLYLIKEFEGRHNDAYLDPAGIPTIGYGTTVYADGKKVRLGDVLNDEKIEKELRHFVDMKLLPALRNVPGWSEMHPRQQAALISFGYNLGAAFYGSPDFSTITRRLKERAWSNMRSAFVLYRDPGTAWEAGLLRRRNREADEWEAGLQKAGPPTPGAFPKGKLHDFFRWYDVKRPQCVEAVNLLEAATPPQLLRDDAAWVKAWRRHDPPLVAPPRPADGEIRLPVSYYSQRDSATSHSLRMCFSSSCAMLLNFVKPGVLVGTNGDDVYLKEVLRHGDTTEAPAQIRALRHFGVVADFMTSMDWADVDRLLEDGYPVPVGWLHHGPVSAPSGGGHWSIIIGRNADSQRNYMHDPYGEADLINGTYNTAAGLGRNLLYSRKNLGKRWMVDGPGTGWGIVFRKLL